MTANYVLLERITVSATVASVTFSNIPQSGYTDMKVVLSTRGDYAAINDGMNIVLNGSSSNFTFRQLYGNGASALSNGGSINVGPNTNGGTSTANTYGNAEIYFPNYTSSSAKSIFVDGVGENNGTTAFAGFVLDLWNPGTNVPITSIGFVSGNAGNIVAGSTFSLYGIAATGTTPVIYPKATGGDIIQTDGTYWYHAFLSTGVFTASENLSCSVLQVAGGGGGANNLGGGGGAGGLLYTASNSIIAGAYAVTVGAGGTGALGQGGAANGGAGTNSSINGLTAIGGGAGLVIPPYGTTGGSGGGVRSTTAGDVGLGTSGQGNNGGYTTTGASSGGGGGAGAAGATSTSNAAGGAGGAGVNTYSSWASITGTGVSGYYAGGGGGGSYQTTFRASGGAGGGGIGGNYDPSQNGGDGIANTGGGGGGGTYDYAGATGTRNGNGGSGIVIVRYAV